MAGSTARRGKGRWHQKIVIAGLVLLLAQLAFGLARLVEKAGETGATATALVSLLIVAAMLQWLVLDRPRPRVLSMGDPGMIAGIVASSLQPGRFANDAALGGGASMAFYATVMRPLVGALNSWVSDLGTAYLLLYGPLALVQGFGFFALGAFILSSRWHALLLALLTLPPVYTNGGDLWGMADEPLTRMLYGAALPYLLLAFLRYYDRRLAFVWLSMLTAATVYLHPVSQPSVAAACLLGAMMAGEGVAFGTRLKRAVAAGLVLLVFMVPYAVVYFSSGVGRMDQVIGAALVGEGKRRFLEAYFGPLYYNVRLAIKALVAGGTGSTQGPWGWRWLVWLGGALALVRFAASNTPYRRTARFFCFFILGILATSVGLCGADQLLAARLGRLPALIDLVRNTRFLFPALLVGTVLALDGLPVFQRRVIGSRLGTAGMVMLTVLWWHWQPTLIVKRAHELLGLAELARPSGSDGSQIIAAARTLPPGSVFLPIGSETVGLALRYGALQPVAFLVKDLNLLLYGAGGDLRGWLQTRDDLDRFKAARDPLEAGSLFRAVVERTRADYVVAEQSSLTPTGRLAVTNAGAVVAVRGDWMIVSVRGKPGPSSR